MDQAIELEETNPQASVAVNLLADQQNGTHNEVANLGTRSGISTWPVIRQLISSYNMLQTIFFWKKANYICCLYFIPLSVAMGTVVVVDWNKSCSQPLKTWALVQLSIQGIILMLNMFIVSKLPPSELSVDIQARVNQHLNRFYISNRILLFIWFLWFLAGCVFTFSKSNCDKASPFLYRLCLSYIVIQIVLFILLQLLYGCHYLLSTLHITIFPRDFTTRGGSRGASEHLINALVTKKIYRRARNK